MREIEVDIGDGKTIKSGGFDLRKVVVLHPGGEVKQAHLQPITSETLAEATRLTDLYHRLEKEDRLFRP